MPRLLLSSPTLTEAAAQRPSNRLIRLDEAVILLSSALPSELEAPDGSDEVLWLFSNSREHAKILLLRELRNGLYCEGLKSEQRWNGPGACDGPFWNHDDHASPIPAGMWTPTGANWNDSSVSGRRCEYIEVMLDHNAVRSLAGQYGPVLPSAKPEAVLNHPAIDSYSTPLLDVMMRAIEEIPLAHGAGTKKHVIVDWLLRQQTEGMSRNMAEAMGTILLEPGRRRGGNTKWRPKGRRGTTGANP